MSDTAPLPRTSTGHALHSLLASVARLAGELAALVVESVRRRVGPDKVPGPVLLVGPERRSGGWAARESEAVAMVLKEEQAAGQRLLQMPGHELVARYVGRLLVPPPNPMTSDLASGCAGAKHGPNLEYGRYDSDNDPASPLPNYRRTPDPIPVYVGSWTR